MPINDPEERKKYAREWMAKRRSEWLAEHGPCVDCGSWDDLEVDHVNPETKLYNPAGAWGRSKANRETELAKCVARCKKCHQAKTAREFKTKHAANPTPLVHGTLAGYEKRGCRCDECLAAMREARREQRRKRGITARPRKNPDGLRKR